MERERETVVERDCRERESARERNREREMRERGLLPLRSRTHPLKGAHGLVGGQDAPDGSARVAPATGGADHPKRERERRREKGVE